MKKRIIKIGLLSLISILSTNIYANDNNTEFDLERVFLGKNSFMGQGNMEIINPNGGDSALIPIVIVSKVNNISKTKKEGYIIDTQIKLELRPRSGPTASSKTEATTILDKNFNIIKYTEKTSEGENEKTIVCENKNPNNKFEGFKFKIGYQSTPQELTCNDGSTRKEVWSLTKSKKTNLADINIDRDMELKVKGKTIKGKEKATITVDKDGNIIEIKSTTTAPGMFNIKYYSQDILQKN